MPQRLPRYGKLLREKSLTPCKSKVEQNDSFKNLNDQYLYENGQTVRFNVEQVKIIGRGLLKGPEARTTLKQLCVFLCVE